MRQMFLFIEFLATSLPHDFLLIDHCLPLLKVAVNFIVTLDDTPPMLYKAGQNMTLLTIGTGELAQKDIRGCIYRLYRYI